MFSCISLHLKSIEPKHLRIRLNLLKNLPIVLLTTYSNFPTVRPYCMASKGKLGSKGLGLKVGKIEISVFIEKEAASCMLFFFCNVTVGINGYDQTLHLIKNKSD